MCVCVCGSFRIFQIIMIRIIPSSNRDILLLHFQFGYLLFIFLDYLLWLEIPVKCWIEVVKANILVVPNLRGKVSVFQQHRIWCLLWVFHMAFIMLKQSLSIPSFWMFCIIKGCSVLFSVFFCINQDDDFFLLFC